MPKTKPFRVAVEGDTVDGRKIERQWLTDIASTYNRDTYGARVNKEHIRGLSGTEPFKALGDVISCATEEIELEIGGKKQKRLALNAVIDATDDLVALSKDRQKIYTSIEVAPNFANSGKAGLVGLAVTDTPASLGTEALTFAVKNPGLMSFGPKLQNDGNVFSLGLETSFALGDGETPPQTEAQGFFAAAAEFFKGLTASKKEETPAAPKAEQKPDAANDNDPRFAAIASGMEAMTKGIEAMGRSFGDTVASLKTDFGALKTQIENTEKPDQFRRAPATGGDGGIVTDC